ncbi:unnamed protein product [Medioppia subpectinata]|uniref:Uncharacterized protein n=1 Tax=Medioppia subpectinata TaxID=1979941 RepID=A0A7R9KL87_9ACAR|nr:unnamed protein product [Medioppia subpectinata]CAG2104326.1 unnamed protein product [Medioppia subpectinata]
MSYIIKLTLLTVVLCAVVEANTLTQLAPITIGTGASDSDNCLSILFLTRDCDPEDAAELEKKWDQVGIKNGDVIYHQANCTADHYGHEMARDVCKD